jgi:hypothetical protein
MLRRVELLFTLGVSSPRHLHDSASDGPPPTYLDTLSTIPLVWILAGALVIVALAVLSAFWRRRRSVDLERPAIRADADVDRDRRLLMTYGTAGLLSAGLGGVRIWQSGSGSSGDSVFDIGQLRDKVGPCFNNSPLGPPFTQPLFIPPAIPPSRVTATADIYDISEARGEAIIVPGFTTPIWGYSVANLPVTTPGPTILARKGREVILNVHNNLPPNEDPSSIIVEQEIDPRKHPFHDSSTSVHLHGINDQHD